MKRNQLKTASSNSWSNTKPDGTHWVYIYIYSRLTVQIKKKSTDTDFMECVLILSSYNNSYIYYMYHVYEDN